MNTIGVIEGFFGPQWPLPERKSYAPFLQKYGGDFYIYAPKQDPHLRKQWREVWDQSYLDYLKDLCLHFQSHGIKFGVGFSPFGLGPELSDSDQKNLREKLMHLNNLGIDMLGLFFDDMPSTENLAVTQIKAVNFVKEIFANQIIFCPSYYTPDPILDKVFGQRPEHYLEDLAENLSPEIELAWTGPKVISPEIPAAHLKEVCLLLKRRPFIWENLFANDGPKNCKFLKLKPFSGRTSDTFKESSGFGFNMMNQPGLSKITYLASKKVMEGMESESAFNASLSELCSTQEIAFFQTWKDHLLKTGLDLIPASEKEQMLSDLKNLSTGFSKEVSDWLMGKYNVGSECLTD